MQSARSPHPSLVAPAALLGWALVLLGGPAPADDAAGPKLVRYKQAQMNEMVDGSTSEAVWLCHGDLRAARSRLEREIDGETWLTVNDGPGGRSLQTNPQKQTATLTALDPKRIKTQLEAVREFAAAKGVTKSEERKDGRDCLKYRKVEGKTTDTWWVDRKTGRPVRCEKEILDPSPDMARSTYVWSDYEWDPEVKDPEALFRTEPPEGYQVKDETTKR